jgi:predicted nucleic acid-binding protein
LSYFFDTSALVKIYHQEDDSDRIIDVFNSRVEIFVSELSVIEYHSVIHRKFREGHLSRIDMYKILKRFEIDLIVRFKLLIFNPLVISSAKEIFKKIGEEIFVRSLDVIQLGFFKSYLKNSDVFLTFDSRQIIAVEELRGKNFFSVNADTTDDH